MSISNVTQKSRDGKYIASGSDDNTVRLWDLQGQSIDKPFEGRDFVNLVAFSPDRRYIVSGSGDRTVRLWDRDLKVDKLLKMGCNQLHEHRLLIEDKGAGDTCLKWGGWNDRDKEEFQARRDRTQSAN